jgi:hypothetical protein
MTPDQRPKQFPSTNQEFFRFVARSILVIGAAAFLILLLFDRFYAGVRLRGGDVLKLLALGLVFGLAATLWRLRWMKWRDSRN